MNYSKDYAWLCHKGELVTTGKFRRGLKQIIEDTMIVYIIGKMGQQIEGEESYVGISSVKLVKKIIKNTIYVLVRIKIKYTLNILYLV